MPIKSVVRSTDVRWATRYLANMYCRGRFVPLKKFLLDVVKALDDACETVAKLLALLVAQSDQTYHYARRQDFFLCHPSISKGLVAPRFPFGNWR